MARLQILSSHFEQENWEIHPPVVSGGIDGASILALLIGKNMVGTFPFSCTDVGGVTINLQDVADCSTLRARSSALPRFHSLDNYSEGVGKLDDISGLGSNSLKSRIS